MMMTSQPKPTGTVVEDEDASTITSTSTTTATIIKKNHNNNNNPVDDDEIADLESRLAELKGSSCTSSSAIIFESEEEGKAGRAYILKHLDYNYELVSMRKCRCNDHDDGTEDFMVRLRPKIMTAQQEEQERFDLFINNFMIYTMVFTMFCVQIYAFIELYCINTIG